MGMETLVIVAAMATAVGAFLLLIVLFGGGARQRDAVIAGRLASYGGEQQGAKGIFARFALLRRAAYKAEDVAAERGGTQMIESALEQANIPLRPGEAIIGMFALAGLLAIVAGAVTQSIILAIALGVGVLVIAFFAVKAVASRERKKFDDQLPDTLTLTSTSLRAGYSLLQAVEAVAQESAEPTRREFARALTEIRLGRPMIDALGDIAVRMESQDFEWAVLAIAIQREVGGNLAEVLQTTAETMNMRNRLRREMKALTAEGRISAVIMAILPFFLFGLISIINPTYLVPLYSTPIGWGMIGFAVLLLIAGVLWMQKIINIEV
jgi:tight adherence protein B